jgi:signal transduction histidine kinase
MRWPLKNQILLRVLLLLTATIAALTWSLGRSAIVANQALYEKRIGDIASLLASARFPLNETVLDHMRQLSGAEFVVVDRLGDTLASSLGAPAINPSPVIASNAPGLIGLDETVTLAGKTYFHSAVPISDGIASLAAGASVNAAPATIHVLVSQDEYRQFWWRSVRPPLLIAAAVLVLAVLSGLAMAGNVTRPLALLQGQVRQIADGNIQRLPESARRDEIGDLSDSVNQMAARLIHHDEQIRQNERLETLVQLSHGIAHNLRNSVTGCKMALDLLESRRNPDEPQAEELQVARRQLGRMSQYIERFLAMARSAHVPSDTVTAPIDLSAILQSVAVLVGPSARHLGVELHIPAHSRNFPVWITRDDAEQVMINLIGNAIDAASARVSGDPRRLALVRTELNQSGIDAIEFIVSDNGAGPPAGIADTLCLPFVTGKQAGTGLGLSVVSDIAVRNGGKLEWSRHDDLTRFVFRFKIGKNDSNTAAEH